MKKLLCLALMLCLLCPPMAALADQTYTGSGYSFNCPDTWTQGIDQDGIEFTLMMSDGASNLNLAIADITLSITNEQFDQLFVPMLIENYQQAFGNIEVVEIESPIQLGDNTFSVFGFNVTMFGIDMYMQQYIYLDGSIAYMFTATYLSQDSAFIEEVQSTLATFTVG